MITQFPNDHASAPPTQPLNLEEALAAVLYKFEPQQQRRIRSDLVVVARCISASAPPRGLQIGDQLCDIPCDPIELRPLLQWVRPGFFWNDKGRWSSLCSTTRKILLLAGWVETDRGCKEKLPTVWEEAAARVSHPVWKAIFRSFGRFCVKRGVVPSAVCEATIEDYRDHRYKTTIELNVDERINTLRRVWNRSQKDAGEWQVRQLAQRPRPGSYVLEDTLLPAKLLESIETYFLRLAAPGPFDRVVGKPRSAKTIYSLRGILKRSASLLVQAGWTPDKLQCVGDLVRPEAVEVILTDQYDRLGKGKSWVAGSITLASYIKMIIGHVDGDLSATEKANSIELCRNVKPGRFGLTRKNRDRLAIYDDPEVTKAWIKLPAKSFEAADRQYQKGGKLKAARLSQAAVALSILQCKPLRRENLAGLDLARHFKFDRRGRPVAFTIDGDETKSGLDAEAVLSDQLADRLKLHIDRYRPLLVTRECSYLFPGKVRGHMNEQSMANLLKEFVEENIGVPYNIHFTRHLVATMILDDDPANGPIAQRVLDHSTLKTTTRFYGAQRGRSAQSAYVKILESKSRTPDSRKSKVLTKRGLKKPMEPMKPKGPRKPNEPDNSSNKE